jgi:hypothetical protein
MPRSVPHKSKRPPLAPSTDALTATPPVLPFYHHPVVALSLVLVVACLAQVAASLVSSQLSLGPTPPSISSSVHDHLFTVIQEELRITLPQAQADRALFAITLSAAILSAAAWYAVARLGLGPSWGLWTALLWVVHPSFAFLAQREDALALLMLLTPLSLALLLWWRRSRRPIAALLAGMSLGLLALSGLQGLLAFPLALAALLVAPVKSLARLAGILLVGLGFGLVLATASTVVWPSFHLSDVIARLRERGLVIMDDGDSPLAVAARRELTTPPTAATPSPTGFLLRQFHEHPADALKWLGRRLWRATYATSNGRLQRPVFALEMIFMVPALWGVLVALRSRHWRWTALICALFAGTFWLAAGLIEPLARNLVPVGGVPILFALLGAADLYERLRARRLTAAIH